MKARALAVFVSFAAFAAPHIAEARGCSEVSDIVGYSKCRRYGDGWASERETGLIFETSISYAWLDPRGRTLKGDFSKNSASGYAYPGELVGHNMSGLPWTLRLGYAIFPWFYAGAEGEIGAASNRLPGTSANGFAIFPSSTGINSFIGGGGGYVGLRLPLSYIAIRAETLFGARVIGVNQDTRSLGGSTEGSATTSLATGLVEPRFFADFWIQRDVTVSLYGGFNALDVGDRIGGLMFGFHDRSYDGGFLPR